MQTDIDSILGDSDLVGPSPTAVATGSESDADEVEDCVVDATQSLFGKGHPSAHIRGHRHNKAKHHNDLLPSRRIWPPWWSSALPKIVDRVARIRDMALGRPRPRVLFGRNALPRLACGSDVQAVARSVSFTESCASASHELPALQLQSWYAH